METARRHDRFRVCAAILLAAEYPSAPNGALPDSDPWLRDPSVQRCFFATPEDIEAGVLPDGLLELLGRIGTAAEAFEKDEADITDLQSPLASGLMLEDLDLKAFGDALDPLLLAFPESEQAALKRECRDRGAARYEAEGPLMPTSRHCPGFLVPGLRGAPSLPPPPGDSEA